MMTETHNEQELADLLDAHIERATDDRCDHPGIEQPAFVADLMREDAQAMRADSAFVTQLSVRLRVAHATRAVPLEQRFIHELLAPFKPAKGKTMTRLTWGLTVLCTVIATLMVVLLTQPDKLPADQLLARATEATLRRAGVVEHIVIETHFTNIAKNTETAYVQEDWKAIGTTMDGYLVATERITARYVATDTARVHPMSWAYETWSKSCFLDLQDYPTVYRNLDADHEGCLSVEQTVRLYIPSPIGQPAEASPQTWVSRLQSGTDDLVYETARLDDQEVYKLTTQRDGMTLLTLYLDRETYRPVRFTAQTPDYILTQTVRLYEVKPREAFSFDPFAWPPASLATPLDAIPHP